MPAPHTDREGHGPGRPRARPLQGQRPPETLRGPEALNTRTHNPFKIDTAGEVTDRETGRILGYVSKGEAVRHGIEDNPAWSAHLPASPSGWARTDTINGWWAVTRHGRMVAHPWQHETSTFHRTRAEAARHLYDKYERWCGRPRRWGGRDLRWQPK